MATAHDTGLYFIGKGILKFDRLVSGAPTGLRDLGNAFNITIGPTMEKLDHFTSREGIKKKDKTITLSAGLSVKFTLDEYDKENLAMALFGDVSGNVVNLLAVTQLEGHLQLVGTNEVGPKFQVDLWKVAIQPTGEVPLIGDNWGEIAFEGEVQSDIANHPDNEYGTITEIVSS